MGVSLMGFRLQMTFYRYAFLERKTTYGKHLSYLNKGTGSFLFTRTLFLAFAEMYT